MKTGVLVVNVGTPESPAPADVRRYLREFLGDPRVLDINPIGRWLLLNLIILPTRPKQSGEAYAKIWLPEGSPLLIYGERVAAALGEILDAEVLLAMRYGQPSIESAMDRLREKGCDRLVIFPVYPQYASSSTGTALEKIYALAGQRWNTPHVCVVPPFYEEPAFLEAFARVGQPVLDSLRPDHVLFSFHGLPERHVRKSDEGNHCFASEDCCDTIGLVNRNCYRAQCYATARGIAALLKLEEADYSVAFQSRLGRTPWIRPYTDEVLPELAQKGHKKVAVFCPAFTADCLETLEEIGIRALESFVAAGGEALQLVPSLNDDPGWIEACASLVRRAMS